MLIKISGQVQGVGLRYLVKQYADQHGLRGWVKNEPDGSVSCWLQNSPAPCKKFLTWLQSKFPGAKLVAGPELADCPEFDGFNIRYN